MSVSEGLQVLVGADRNLRQAVVYLVGYLAPLFLLGYQQFTDQMLQLLLAFAQRLLGPLALGTLFGLAYCTSHRRSKPLQPLLQHVVRGAALEGLDSPLFPQGPDTRTNGTSGRASCVIFRAERPSNAGSE